MHEIHIMCIKKKNGCVDSVGILCRYNNHNSKAFGVFFLLAVVCFSSSARLSAGNHKEN